MTKNFDDKFLRDLCGLPFRGLLLNNQQPFNEKLKQSRPKTPSVGTPTMT